MIIEDYEDFEAGRDHAYIEACRKRYEQLRRDKDNGVMTYVERQQGYDWKEKTFSRVEEIAQFLRPFRESQEVHSDSYLYRDD
jgi:hypothetical protein